MGNSKHEDAIMKMGFHYFRDTILKLLGIDYNYVDIGPTELVELTIQFIRCIWILLFSQLQGRMFT